MDRSLRRVFVTAVVSSTLASSVAVAGVRTFTDEAVFLAQTGATNASGPIPDLGMVPFATVGSIGFAIAPGGDNMAIGAVGSPQVIGGDWYPLTPGNDIALGYENLLITTSGPVYSLAIRVVEPDTTMPSWGGTPVDSNFLVTLLSAGVQVGQTTVRVPDDVDAVIGVWSDVSFDQVAIVDVTVSQFIDDDEYFQEVFTGTTPAPIFCPADLTTGAIPGQPGYGIPNGVLTNDDFFYYLTLFAAGC
ncbi:MAG: hypothetical protein KDA05_09025 [Phycisphaerales bacterium]|nr:hypothetical protein [Phycisphaerales bacterium]MCB9841028.1 hypothetical protein [Phycisphaeraceae bacterium]